MMKKPCPNYNHHRTFISISYCPQCGEKFHSPVVQCDDEKHRHRKKDRHQYCLDCGKNLKLETK